MQRWNMTGREKILVDAFACGYAILARALADRRRKYYILAGSGILCIVVSLFLHVSVLMGRYKEYGLVSGSVFMAIALVALLAARLLPWPALSSVSWQQAFLVLKPWKTGGIMVGSALPSGGQAVHFAVNDRKLLELAEQLPGVPASLEDESRKNDVASHLLEELNSVSCGTISWSFIQRDAELGQQVAGLIKSRPDLLEDACQFESSVAPGKGPAVSTRLSNEIEVISRHLDVNEANKACLKRCRDMIDGCLADSRKHEETLNQQAASFRSGTPAPDKEGGQVKFNRDEIHSQISGSFDPVLQNLEMEAEGIIKDKTAGKDRDIAAINERLKADVLQKENEAGKILLELDKKISGLGDGMRDAEEDLRRCEEMKSRMLSEIGGDPLKMELSRGKYNMVEVSRESAAEVVKALNIRMDKLKHEHTEAEARFKADIARIKNTAESGCKVVQDRFEKAVEDARVPVREIETRRSQLLGLLDSVNLESKPDQRGNTVCYDSDTWISRIIERRISIMRESCGRIGSCLARLEGIALDLQNKFSGSLWDSAAFGAVRDYFFIPFVTVRISRWRKEQFHLLVAPVVEEQKKAGYGGIFWNVDAYEGKQLADYCLQSCEQKLCFPDSSKEFTVAGEDRKIFLRFIDQAIIDRMIKDNVALEMLKLLTPRGQKRRPVREPGQG